MKLTFPFEIPWRWVGDTCAALFGVFPFAAVEYMHGRAFIAPSEKESRMNPICSTAEGGPFDSTCFLGGLCRYKLQRGAGRH